MSACRISRYVIARQYFVLLSPRQGRTLNCGMRPCNCESRVKESTYACSRSFMFNSYRTRTFTCSTVVRRDINSVFEMGVDSSVDGEGLVVIAVGELGAEPGVACRLSEERALIMFVAFLSVVRKSSTIGIVRECNETRVYAPTFAQ
jgi:hypothetical protein